MTILPVQTRSSEANSLALDRLYAVFPVWNKVVQAAEVIDFPPFTLLHAGPPFKDPCSPSFPILSSASLCAVYEGWAATPETAIKMIRAGKIKLLPAQNFGAVTPLAAVISPSATLVEVVDAASKEKKACWSELSSGPGPMLRFGSRDLNIIDRMRFREKWLAPRIAKLLEKGPIPLFPHALNSIRNGDDLHASTFGATASLIEYFSKQRTDEGLKKEFCSLLQETPLFFLTLWMASCHLMLSAMANKDSLSTLVIALAGNGQECGIRISGDPEKWRVIPAGKPVGNSGENECVSGVLGDSGCVDAAGFGAQLWLSSTLTGEKSEVRAWPEHEALWGVGQHPFFYPHLSRCAIDITRITYSTLMPHIAIAMLDEQGRKGLLGKGIYKTEKIMYQPKI